MNGDTQQHHWLFGWIFTRWPKWAKIASVVSALVAIGGGVTTALGLWGQLGSAIHDRDTKLQAAAIAKQLDKERDDTVDKTLAEHGKQITDIKSGVQEIQGHLSRQDTEMIGTHGQLDRIESAILNQGAARLSLPALPTPILPTPTVSPH